jgi:hypothetical protein
MTKLVSILAAAGLLASTAVAMAQADKSPTPTQPGASATDSQKSSSDNMPAGTTGAAGPKQSEEMKGAKSQKDDPTAKPTEPEKRTGGNN